MLLFQIKETLVMLEGANCNSITKYKNSLQQVASAFGIVGEAWMFHQCHWSVLAWRAESCNLMVNVFQ